MTDAQLATLRTNILTLAAPGQPLELLVAAGNTDAIADYYNALAVPDWFVWRTSVSRADIYSGNPQPENSAWNWTTYKNQSATEQGAWTQMFMGDQANFAQDNIRAGVSAIFTGSAQANAQRDHVLAVARRQANRLEKLFAVGTGSTAAPAKMGFEGTTSGREVFTALHP